MSIGPYYNHNGITIYNADCRDLLLTILNLVEASAIITDPPYGCKVDEWDLAAPYDLLPVMWEHSVGPIVWFGSLTKIAEALRSFAREPRVAVWAPKFTLSHTMANGIAYRWHPIYLWRLPKKHSGPTWDVLTDSTERGNWWKHKGTKPLSLMIKLCGLCPPGGVVLDPFMGSGTTLVAAKELGLRAIGIEINEEYCQVAVDRLRQEVIA